MNSGLARAANVPAESAEGERSVGGGRHIERVRDSLRTMTTRARRRWAFAPLLLLVVACSGGDDAGPSGTSAPDTPPPTSSAPSEPLDTPSEWETNEQDDQPELDPSPLGCQLEDTDIGRLRQLLVEDARLTGPADYPGNPDAEIPKATAALLLGEINCARLNDEWDTSELERLASSLISWPSRNGSEPFGWGLPFEWDAFGDGTTNPTGTVYSISTAITIKALLTFVEFQPGAKDSVYPVVDEALREWIRPESFGPNGQLVYSLSTSDAEFDVYNSSIMLAGQMARFARTDWSDLSQEYAEAADAVMETALADRRVDDDGYWYWGYSATDSAANDLAHAAYVLDGVAHYVAADGRFADFFPVGAVAGHLDQFVSDGDIEERILPWPTFRSPELTSLRSRQVRLYDVGWGLYASSQFSEINDAQSALCATARRHRSVYGTWLKYATDVEADGSPNPVIHEYLAYLYLGLTSLATSECDLAAELESWERLPFAGGDTQLYFEPDTLHSRIVDGERQLEIAVPSVPLSLDTDPSGRTVAAFRTFPQGQLALARWVADTALPTQVLPGQDDVNLMLRGTLILADRFYAVVYDNADLENRIMEFNWPELSLRREVALPSLEPAAGWTYEMEPPIFLLGGLQGPRVIGGTLSAYLTPHGLTASRLDGCSKVLEVEEAAHSVAVLCETPDGFQLTSGATSIDIESEGAPFDLRMEDGEWLWSDSHSATLAEFVQHEISTGQHRGVLEFGVDNQEGRVAWSQISYLFGLLDLLEFFGPDTGLVDRGFIDDVRRRVDLEIRVLDRLVGEVGFESRGFTIDRSPALFAVQTSRVGILYSRYLSLSERPVDLPHLRAVAARSIELDGHEESIDRSGIPGWIDSGVAFLTWHRGDQFPFDGANVPYNHQNEWALGVHLWPGQVSRSASEAAADVLDYFKHTVLINGAFPPSSEWPYWWGWGYDGWSERDAISVNRPDYDGDRGLAWISFRTIDATAIVETSTSMSFADRGPVLDSAAALVIEGQLQPRLAASLLRVGATPTIGHDARRAFGRAASPTELADAIWAHALTSAS
jgi:hypothetical protein